MARNEEKQLSRLNRFLLKQQKDEYEKKNPKRPKLDELHSANEIKQWLPSIKKDIDFCLKQSQVPCYPQRKIEEFHKKIDYLKREYRTFVHKLKEVNPGTTTIPWTDRAYEAHKREKDAPVDSDHTDEVVKKLNSDKDEKEEEKDDGKDRKVQQFSCIVTPVLNKDKVYKHTYGYSQPCYSDLKFDVNEELQDQPLRFVSSKLPSVTSLDTYNPSSRSHITRSSEDSNELEVQEKALSKETNMNKPIQEVENMTDEYKVKYNLLHIPYSDSDSDG